MFRFRRATTTRAATQVAGCRMPRARLKPAERVQVRIRDSSEAKGTRVLQRAPAQLGKPTGIAEQSHDPILEFAGRHAARHLVGGLGAAIRPPSQDR